jgi:hypothetical protein
VRPGRLSGRRWAGTYPVSMPKPSTSPAGRAPVRVTLRRLSHLLALTAIALPLVALEPAGAYMDAPDAPEAAAVVSAVRPADLDEHLVAERRELTLTPTTIVIEDPDLRRGSSKVVEPGEPGLLVETGLALLVDGEVEAWLMLERTVISLPVARIERVGIGEVPRGAVWDALARCESRGRWDAVRWIGDEFAYRGGLQFDPRTWNAFRPTGYPALASDATREQQIAVAERVLARQGWGAWPACSLRLGLR